MPFFAEILPSGEKNLLLFPTDLVDTCNGRTAMQYHSVPEGQPIPKGFRLIPCGFPDRNEVLNSKEQPSKIKRKTLKISMLFAMGYDSDNAVDRAIIDGKTDWQARCSEAFERKFPLLDSTNKAISNGIITITQVNADVIMAMHGKMANRNAFSESYEALHALLPEPKITAKKEWIEWITVLKNPETTEEDIYRVLKKLAGKNENNELEDARVELNDYRVPDWWLLHLKDRRFVPLSSLLEFAKRFSAASQDNGAAAATSNRETGAERKEREEKTRPTSPRK